MTKNDNLFFFDENEAEECKKKALSFIPQSNNQIESFQYYLDKKVTPLLLEALINTAKTRPGDPIEYLAYYLLDNNKINN